MPFHSAAALTLLAAAAFAVAAPPAAVESRSQSPDPVGRAVERFNLGLRGVYFVENRGQWSDGSVCFGLKSRGLDVAFRESSFTMHLSRERSEPGCATLTSLAREEAGLGEESERPSIDLHDPYGLVSDYGGHFADHRVPLSRGRRAPLAHGRGSSGDLLHDEIRGVEDSAPAYEHLTLTVSFPGSNAVTPRGAREQTAKFNYFVGGEGRGTASNVPSFAAVIYEDLYDGIDLFITGNDDGVMKYEFHCDPGADYTQIRIHYDGIDSLCVNDEGDLEIATSFGTLRDGAPIVWQEGVYSLPRLRGGGPGRGSSDLVEMPISASAQGSIHPHPDPPPQSRGREQGAAARQTIPARFELCDARTYRITLDAAPDPAQPLVIDPEVEWMRYLGGSSIDAPFGVTVDSADNLFVVGWTDSTDFEGRTNQLSYAPDGFVARLSPEGELEWMTYCGGFARDRAHGVCIDPTGLVLVTGVTSSRDFPARHNEHHGGQDDAFIARIAPHGVVLSMAYLGGTGEDWGWDIAIDPQGSALVSGYTNSVDFEGRQNQAHGDGDAFVLKIGAGMSLRWMTYLGGSRTDGGRGSGYYYVRLSVDSEGNACVCGDTNSSDFEGRINDIHNRGSSHPDAFVVKVSPSGRILWMRYLGGFEFDFGSDVAVTQSDAIIVVGWTISDDFEGRRNTRASASWDGYAARVLPNGALHGMWYYGGAAEDTCDSLAVDAAGNIIITGWTQSRDWIGRTNSFYGVYDAFALKVNWSGQVLSFTYLGGSGRDGGDAIALDSTGSAIVCGETGSSDYEGSVNGFHGERDAAVVKVAFTTPRLAVASPCPAGGMFRVTWSDATPDGRVVLAFSREEGEFVIPGGQPCEGTILGLGRDHRQVVHVGSAGRQGSRTLRAVAEPVVCGGYVQLLDLTTCSTSNVERVE